MRNYKEKFKIFKKAQKEGWAIGQFNFSNLEVLRAIFQAAKNFNSPIIVGTSEGESQFFGMTGSGSYKKGVLRKI